MDKLMGMLSLLRRFPARAFCVPAALTVAMLGLAGCAMDQVPPASLVRADVPVSSAAYRLGPGDHVNVTVFGDKGFTGEHDIDGAGMIALPLIGRVHAEGVTPVELERAIATRLSPDYIRDANVTVELVKYRPFYIVGEVRNQGSYPYVPRMSVIDAIALAGGYTYRAKETSFYLYRQQPGGQTVRVLASQETPVQPGDVVQVRERYF